MQSSSIIEIIIKLGGVQMNSRRRPTHPGELLREDVIKPLGLTVTEAAKRLGVTRKTLSALINCKASMSPEMAVRIGKATRTSPESWLYMQAKLDLWLAQQKPPEVEGFGDVAVA
jgi:addiction module HigA family antidote